MVRALSPGSARGIAPSPSVTSRIKCPDWPRASLAERIEPDMRQAIETPAAPAPRGPYSQRMLATGRHLYVAGQGPLDPAPGEIAGEAFAVQARRTLKNVKAVLEAGGAPLSDVVQVTVYLADWKYLGELNEIYGEYFPAPCPARTPIQMAVPLGLIMLDTIAVIAEPEGETR